MGSCEFEKKLTGRCYNSETGRATGVLRRESRSHLQLELVHMQIASDATFESSDDVPRTRNPSNTSNSPNDNNNSNNNQNNSNTSNNNNNNGSSSRSGSGSRHNHGNITSNNSNNNNNKSNNDRSGSGSRHEPVFDEDVESRRKSPRITTPSSERTDPMSLPSINNFEALSPGMRPSPSDIAWASGSTSSSATASPYGASSAPRLGTGLPSHRSWPVALWSWHRDIQRGGTSYWPMAGMLKASSCFA